MSKIFDDKEINSIVRSMQRDKCVLFLGQEISRNADNETLHDCFLQNMADEFSGEVEYDKKEGFLFYYEPDVKNDVIFEMMDYYEKNKSTKELLQTIVQLPFHLIISFTPDTTLVSVFEDSAIDYEFLDFEKRKEKECGEPKKDHSVVYNLPVIIFFI